MALADTAKLIASLELKDNFSRGIGSATASLGKLETRLGKIGGIAAKGVSNANQNIQRLGVAAAGIGAGLLVGAVKSAIDFEDAFSGVVKTVNEADLKAAGLTFADLNQQFRQMALDIPIAATELAVIGEAAGALGIRAQDIEEFTRVVAQLSVTTNLTSEAAATALGQLGTILQLTGDDFAAFGDTLVALGNSGASTEEQIVELAARFAAAGKSAGLSNNDILALSSAVTSMGIDVEAGGSALSRVFNNVATNIGIGSAKAQEFADALGLSAKDFKKAWAEDALGTFEDFLGKLNELDQFEAAALLKKVGITNTRDVVTVRLMAQNIGFVNEALETSRTATGALGEEAAKKFATTASQLQLLKNTVVDIGITIGNELLPIILDVAKEARDFLGTPKAQSDLKKFAKDLAAGFRDLITAVKGVDWASVAGSLKSAAGFAKGIMDAFLGAPDWLKTAIITGWGLNKLTGGAVGSIIGELGKGLIKGVLGMNAGVVNIKAGVVNGVGGAGGAGAAGGLGLLGGLLGGATIFAGLAAAIDQLGRLPTLIESVTDAGRARDLVDVKNTLTKMFEGSTVAQPFKAFLPDFMRLLGLENPSGRLSLEGTKNVGAIPRAGVTKVSDAGLDPIAAATSGALNSLNGKIEVTNPALGDTAAALGRISPMISQLLGKYDVNNNNLVRMREVIATDLGLTVGEMRALKLQSGGFNAIFAAKVGLTNEELRILIDKSRGIHEAVRDGTQTLKNKDWKPTINVKVPVNLSLRGMDRGLVTYRTVVGRRGVGVF